jgi:hypothetical protein
MISALETNFNKRRIELGSEMCSYCENIVGDALHLHALRGCPFVMPILLNIVHVSAQDDFFYWEFIGLILI